MMQSEFESRIDDEVTEEEYEIIQTVYIYYPGVHHVDGKDEVANLYLKYGMAIFRDMLQRAEGIQECETFILQNEAKIKALKEKKLALEEGREEAQH